MEFNTSLSIFYYFLFKEDREIEINPILLKEEIHLADLGFKNILEISRVGLGVKICQRKFFVSLKVKNVLGEASLTTLSLVKLHFDHLIKHHVQNNMGLSLEEIYDGDDFL